MQPEMSPDESACFRGAGCGGPITHVLLDYGGTLTDPQDPVDGSGLRPVSDAARRAVWDLDRLGVTVGLLSNTRPGQDRRRALRAAGLDRLFGDRVFCSAAIGVAKPAQAIFWCALVRLDARPHQVLMVGNNPEHDIWPARRAGMPAVLISEQPTTADDALAPGAIRLDRIARLPALIEGTVRHG